MPTGEGDPGGLAAARGRDPIPGLGLEPFPSSPSCVQGLPGCCTNKAPSQGPQ